jgi:hypothetical protein
VDLDVDVQVDVDVDVDDRLAASLPSPPAALTTGRSSPTFGP